MVYRIPEAKPRIKGNGSAVDVSEEKPALAYDPNSDIIMFSEESWITIGLSWLKTSFMFLMSAMLIFTVMYGTLAASLLFATPVGDKVTVIARDTFLGGIPAKDDMVLASPTQAAGQTPVDRLKDAAFGVKDAQIVKILSGPNDTVQISNGKFAIGGQETGSYEGTLLNAAGQPVTATFQLANQYVTACVSGGCAPETFIIVDDKNLYGELVDFEGKK
jgi:hypothetical protein